MSVTDRCDFESILKRYPQQYQPQHVESPADTRGFSGAVVVRVDCPAGQFALRGWPPDGLSRKRILGLHRLLAEISRRGVSQVAVPVASSDGTRLINVQNRLWQLEGWMPGKADFHENPSEARLRAAMACLAGWHRAAATFEPRPEEAAWFSSQSLSPSPAVSERLELIDRWTAPRREELRRRMAHSGQTEFRRTAEPVLDLFTRAAPRVAEELRTVRERKFRLQPCLRDVWHDHLLFTGDEVTGLIDASACRAENVATDLARLLGSLVGDRRADWDIGLNEYQKHRLLTLDELALVFLLDRSAVLLSGMTWLDRHYLQRSEFGPPERILDRLKTILARLAHVCQFW